MKKIAHLVTIAICCISFAAAPAKDQKASDTKPQKTEFLRFVQAKDGSAKLETGIGHYVNANGQSVDLVGAVHIADAAFYQDLNTRFKKYDAVLYEMVKPEGAAVPPPGTEPRSMIGNLQKFMTRTLDLTYQLDGIDYSATNFVHADMDSETFQKRMDARGESFFSIMLHAMLNPPKNRTNPDIQLGQLIFALQAPDRPRQLKLLLGSQFQDIDAQTAALEGPDGGVILSERNKTALKVLQDELDKGTKHIAIFYGAAHLKGMEADLLKNKGFKPTGEDWLTAWNISAPAAVANQPATQPAAGE
jgi:hypothetical protein